MHYNWFSVIKSCTKPYPAKDALAQKEIAMLDSITIENFRGIERTEIKELTRISLISGRNNVGKTTVLEALFLLMDHTTIDSFAKLGGFRGSLINGGVSLWEPLFYQMDVDRRIKICVSEGATTACLTYEKDENYLPYNTPGMSEDMLAQFRSATKSTYSLLFKYMVDDYNEEGHFSLNGINIMRDMKTNLLGNEIRAMRATQFLNATIARVSDSVLNGIGKLELSGKKSIIIAILKELDPRIEDILTLSLQGITQLYLRIAGKLIPLQYAGDGVMKLLNICLAVLERKNGLVLIDEIESGFHYSMYKKLWRIIDKISKESNCQVIATTHSYELIQAVQESPMEIDDFSYYRMEQGNHDTSVFRYSYGMLDSALVAEMEVR